jgi:hypothetical protein
MRFIIHILAACMLSVSFSSCLFMGPSIKGDGNVVEDERDVGSFSDVRVTSGMNVHFVQGDTLKVVVVADENLLDMIETNVISGTLEIKTLANIWSATSKKVVVTAKRLREIQAAAGSNAFSENQLQSDNLKLRASSGSNVRLDIDAGLLEISASSGANIYLTGSAKHLIAKTSSGGNLKAEDFMAEVSDIKVSSGSNAWVTAMKELTAHASSGGNVFYYGSPDKTNTSSSSGGNVHKR